MSKNIFLKLRLILLCILIVDLTFVLGHNNDLFEQITVDDGLSNSTVFSVGQDKLGFMWFGTVNGLNKFDGYKFTIYEHDPNDSTSISNNNAGNIFIDSKGFIWVGTWGGGLSRLNPVTNKFTRYLHNPLDSTSISGDRVQTIYEDKLGDIWIGTFLDGLNRMDRRTGTFKVYKNIPGDSTSLIYNRIWAITEDKKDCLWIGTSRGLNCFNRKTEKFRRFIFFPNDTDSNIANFIRTLHFSSNNILWVGTQNGLIKFDLNTKKYQRHIYSDLKGLQSNVARINCIAEAPNGDLWLGTGYGLIHFETKSGQSTRYIYEADNPNSISDNEIRSLFIDSSGILWIGTRSQGISKFNMRRKAFYSLPIITNPENASKENTVFSIYEKDDNLYVGTLDGLVKKNLVTGDIKRFRNNPLDSTSIANAIIRNILDSHIYPDQLWLNINQGLSLFDLKTESFKNFYFPEIGPAAVNYRRGLALFEDDQKTLWIGDFRAGVNKFDLRSGKILKQFIANEIKGAISNSEVWFIKKNDAHSFWVGTGNGLNLFDINTETFSEFKFDKYNKHSKRFYSIHKENNGILWLGTDHGLLKFNPNDGTYENFSKEQGLPDNKISSILNDAAGNLWLGTGRGICCFTPSNQFVVNYNRTDGLTNYDYIVNAAFRNKSGRLYFGGMNGIDYFNPDEIQQNSYLPEVVLTDIKILNRSIGKLGRINIDKSVNYLDELTLQRKEYLFSIEFSALDFAFPRKNNYAYMLEGIDEKWILTDADHRVATYTNIPGGTYVFKVKATGESGVWTNKIKKLRIIIIPHFYETAWFKILVILLTIVSIYLFIRYRTKNIKKRSQELRTLNRSLKEQIVERERAETEKNKLHDQLLQSQKMEALGTLSGGIAHDFNNLLTVINGHTEIALMQETSSDLRRHLEAIQQGSERAEDLTRQLLAFGRRQLVDVHVLNLNKIIKTTENMIRRIIPEDIQIKTELDENLPNIKADPGQIEQILINLIINARDAIQQKIAKPHQSLIRISTSLIKADNVHLTHNFENPEVDHILLSVSDSGIGMDKKLLEHIFEPFFTTKEISKGTGLGLSTVYGIVRQNSGRINAESIPGKGTTFHIFWPVTEEKAEFDDQANKDEKKELNGTENILLVEDDKSVCDFAVETLNKFGYSVSFASNGIEALEIVKERGDTFDLVITDLIMPKMNGHEFVEKLDCRIDKNKVLYVSGYTFEHLHKEGKLDTEIHFLQKPYTIEKLLLKIRGILSS